MSTPVQDIRAYRIFPQGSGGVNAGQLEGKTYANIMAAVAEAISKAIAGIDRTVKWEDIEDKPKAFTPTRHEHDISTLNVKDVGSLVKDAILSGDSSGGGGVWTDEEWDRLYNLLSTTGHLVERDRPQEEGAETPSEAVARSAEAVRGFYPATFSYIQCRLSNGDFAVVPVVNNG